MHAIRPSYRLHRAWTRHALREKFNAHKRWSIVYKDLILNLGKVFALYPPTVPTQNPHFRCRCRGQIKVKGKGDMITYFLNEHNAQNQHNNNGHRDYRGSVKKKIE